MADVYIADSTYAKYVERYGRDDAKAEIRAIVKEHAPGDDDE